MNASRPGCGLSSAGCRFKRTLAYFEAPPYTLLQPGLIGAAAGRQTPESRCAFTSQTLPLMPPHRTPREEGSRRRAVAGGLRTQADSLAVAVFPASCAVCDTPLARLSRAPVCDPCWADLPSQSGTLCLRCGEALGPHLFASEDRAPGDWLCRPCRVVPPAFERAVAHGLYRGTMRSLLHLLKYEGLEPVARPLGALMAAQIAALPGLPRQIAVVPVPLFAGKRRQRGFNQAELLAQSLARALGRRGLEVRLETGLLVRTRATHSQAGLSPSGRRRNLQAAFAVNDGKLLPSRDVLLVDDIYTTGATARAASSALRRAGAREVWVATAARAQKQEFLEPVHAMETPMEEDVAFWG